MNDIRFLQQVKDLLVEHKRTKQYSLSRMYKPDYFQEFKDNPYDEWGKICLTLQEVENRLQVLFDEAEKEMEK